MKTTIAILFATAFLLATVVIAQEPVHPPQPPHPPNPDPLAHLMFPPDMILNHARELNLTDEQKAFMRSEVQKATVAFQDLQWKLQDQM
jgi:Spy/CpxP family protein refolding chaperone